MFLKIEAKAFEAGDFLFLTFLYGFGVFEVDFRIKMFLTKKACIQPNNVGSC